MEQKRLKNGTVQHVLTEDEARKGGKKSGKVRKEKRIIREEIEKRLDAHIDAISDGLLERSEVSEEALKLLLAIIGQAPAKELNIRTDLTVEQSVDRIKKLVGDVKK